MPNLKDTDFDDLFRRASDKYPLRTDSSDWDRMAAALEKDPTPDQSGDLGNPDKRRRRRFFWLFLLLPLGGLGYYAWHQTGHSTGNAANTVARANSTAPQPEGAATPATSTNTQPGGTTSSSSATGQATPPSGAATPPTTGATPAAPARPAGKGTSKPTTAPQPVPAETKPATASATVPSASPNRVTPNRTTNSDRTVTPDRTTNSPGHPTVSAGSSLATRTPANPAPSGKKARSGHSGNPAPAGRFAADNTSYPDNNPAYPTTAVSKTSGATPVTDAFTLKAADVNEQRARIAAAWRLTVDVKAPPKDTSSAIKKTSAKQRSSYLYAGILAAPDLSMVKFQSMKGVGSTFGVLVGYAFNDKWAIETGAYVDRKRYYTSGEYFYTKQGSLPNGTWLNNVDGTCYMWEIPLNVRYNFNPGGKTKWFATAGLSTYLMNKEKYTYNYGWAGSWPGSHDSTWNIKTPSQYPFSIINLSAGFEQHLGKVGNLRIEPYVRIPLANMGTGKLPIMSAGVNIGITRRLW